MIFEALFLKVMKFLFKLCIFNLILLSSSALFSQVVAGTESLNVKTPEWKASFSQKEARVGDVIEIVLEATAPTNWYIYSTHVFCEFGPGVATFNFTKTKGLEPVGSLYSVGDKRFIDDVFNCSVGKFEKKAELRHKIKILSTDFELSGYFEGQMCSDITGLCVTLETEDLHFKGLQVLPAADGSTSSQLNHSGTTEASNTTTPSSSQDQTEVTEIHPGQIEQIIQRLDQIYGAQDPNPVVNTDPFIPENMYIKESDSDTSKCVKKTYIGNVGGIPKESLLGFFLLAFLSGLAALITPCVFPMIPMTVAFFMKGDAAKKKSKSLTNGLIFGVSIILIYTVLGSFFGVLFGPEAANFIATHWIPNVFFFLVFVFFAAAFFGAFELVLPSWVVNKVDKQADRGGYIGIFFMALTLALVSFSCTGPIVGVVIVESLSGNFLKPVIGMFGFSLAFALPFTLFAMFPTWLNSLPKGGGWLNSVKVTLGFLELALGLKFLSLADQTYHWGILDREVYIALWIVIFTLLGLYLMGKIKFAHDSDLAFLKVPRLILAVLTFSFVIYLVPGMFGAPLKALAGYLPPMATHDFALLDKLSGPRGVLCEEPKYKERLHLPHNLQGYFDYEQGMACAKRLNKPVFIDFTGHGCVNCREMEARVWSDQRVLDILSNEYVIIALYVDDKVIELPQEEHYISKVTGRPVTTLSKKNSDIQSCMFGSNSQPNYILLDHNENLLNFPTAYDLNVENFVRFLRTGISNFKKTRNSPAAE